MVLKWPFSLRCFKWPCGQQLPAVDIFWPFLSHYILATRLCLTRWSNRQSKLARSDETRWSSMDGQKRHSPGFQQSWCMNSDPSNFCSISASLLVQLLICLPFFCPSHLSNLYSCLAGNKLKSLRLVQTIDCELPIVEPTSGLLDREWELSILWSIPTHVSTYNGSWKRVYDRRWKRKESKLSLLTKCLSRLVQFKNKIRFVSTLKMFLLCW